MSESETPRVWFRVTTRYRLPRGAHGPTSIASKPLSLGDALGWVMADLPEEAVTVTPDIEGDNDAVTIRVDWSKVPPEIRDGRP